MATPKMSKLRQKLILQLNMELKKRGTPQYNGKRVVELITQLNSMRVRQRTPFLGYPATKKELMLCQISTV